MHCERERGRNKSFDLIKSGKGRTHCESGLFAARAVMSWWWEYTGGGEGCARRGLLVTVVMEIPS